MTQIIFGDLMTINKLLMCCGNSHLEQCCAVKSVPASSREDFRDCPGLGLAYPDLMSLEWPRDRLSPDQESQLVSRSSNRGSKMLNRLDMSL